MQHSEAKKARRLLGSEPFLERRTRLFHLLQTYPPEQLPVSVTPNPNSARQTCSKDPFPFLARVPRTQITDLAAWKQLFGPPDATTEGSQKKKKRRNTTAENFAGQSTSFTWQTSAFLFGTKHRTRSFQRHAMSRHSCSASPVPKTQNGRAPQKAALTPTRPRFTGDTGGTNSKKRTLTHQPTHHSCH